MKSFIIAGSGLAVGAVVLSLLFAGPPALELDLPIYAVDAGRSKFFEYTSKDYDDLAKFDVTIMGHETLIGDQHNGLVDSVRTRNENWIYLVYVFAYGCHKDWDVSKGFYKDLWDMIDRNDYWMRYADGTIVNHWYNNNNMWMFNQGAEGLADSLGLFYSSWMKERDNVRHHVGFFVDWITVPYPEWAIANRDSIDLNRNGIAYAFDPGDEEQNSRFPYQIDEAFRKYIEDDTFLIVPNGGIHRQNGYEFAHLFDGAMNELVNLYYPKPEQWERAMVDSRFLNTSRVDPPLLMFQAGSQDSSGFCTEAQASIANGMCAFQFGHLDRKLTLGKRVSEPLWAEDTVSAFFVKGKDQFLVRAISDPFIWPYLIVSLTTGDTLSRGGGWLAQKSGSPLRLVLDDYEDYLADKYGEPIGLEVLSKWAETSSEITEICE